MIIQCPNCKTRYHYEESRFGPAPAKKIRCTKCTSVFEIRNPRFESVLPAGFEPEETGPLNSPALSPDDFSLESTVMGGPRRAKVGANNAPVVASRPPSQPGGYPQGYPQQGYPPQQAPYPQQPGYGQRPGTPTTGEYAKPSFAGPESAVRKLKLPDWERLSVAIITGPDAGRIFEIDKPRVIIGRANADILLSDGEVSRAHAAIEVSDTKAVLIDLGSTNGTFVGDRRITQVDLDNRSEFDIGATTLMFIRTRKESGR
ncbi:MAG: zinc-ribbon domain-containing protein [Acidobacteria bacterium]|nr:zinc-ribbon domain-containing protein [Acidobacteriota bacterium]MCG3192084.1 hypothetical protein [Thermoanaerobaculia bacterium]MCK6682348.1 zinc-ribbon domain-containing protein [Thermoanaerobaculia bacterium]